MTYRHLFVVVLIFASFTNVSFARLFFFNKFNVPISMPYNFVLHFSEEHKLICSDAKILRNLCQNAFE